MSPAPANRTALRALLLHSLAALAALALASCASRPRERTPVPAAVVPPPTEHRLAAGAEEEQRERREAWFEAMHRAAPGVDWRAIERANGLAEQERRRLASLAPGPLGPGGPSPWTEIGSDNQAGRAHCAALSPDGVHIYTGSALGGVWRGELGAGSWEPLGDNLFGGVHELVVLPGEIAGDPDFLLGATDGGQVSASRDDGASWETPGGIALRRMRGLASLDDASRTLLVYGRRNGAGSRSVLFASTDYGRNFTVRWEGTVDWRGGIWVPRTGPGAATDVYLLDQGELWTSTDGGVTFQLASSIDPAADRGVLTGSESGAPTLYAALRDAVTHDWTLYRSDDGGATWAAVHTITDFWQSLCASSVDPDLVLYGGVECWRSADGGVSFAKVNNWWAYYSSPADTLHADLPGIHCHPDPSAPTGERWTLATDGGLYQSLDGVLTVENLSLAGLGIGQYYSTLSSALDGDRILAGAQDQGYQHGVRQPPAGPGPSTPFDQLISGDYGHLTSSDGSHGIVYSTYPGFVLVSEGEVAPQIVELADFPVADMAWLPPVVADPLDPESAFLCADQLYRYDRTGPVSWAFGLHSTQSFAAGASTYLSAIAFAPGDPQRAYAVTDDGDLYTSTDHGVTWTLSPGTAPGPHYFYGNAIAVHPDDPLEVAVGGSGYSAPGVLRSTDGGLTWNAETDGLPSTMVYALVYARNGSGDLYAGTRTAAYRWQRATATWELISGDAPITIYWSAEVVDGGQTVRFGTYGRGIWDYAVPPGGPLFVRGDCSADGLLDLGDAIHTLTALFDGPIATPCLDACDTNDDGVLNLADAVHTLLYVVAGDPTPAPPHPACGPDGTPDSLDCTTPAPCP